MKKIICLEKPKMQNKKDFFFFFGNPNIQGWGGDQAVGTKSQLVQNFLRLPKNGSALSWSAGRS